MLRVKAGLLMLVDGEITRPALRLSNAYPSKLDNSGHVHQRDVVVAIALVGTSRTHGNSAVSVQAIPSFSKG